MGCTHDCDSCSSKCGEEKSLVEKPHEMSSVKKIIGVVSGKGGVGKSLITSMLAVTLNRRGVRAAILDADVTGPSIPKMFGIKEKAVSSDLGLLPARSKTDIQIMSANLLLENDTDPVVWRGPVISGLVKQFWTDVIWNDVEYLFVDMPPGTGDVPLTVFQSLPIDGIVIATAPQELVSMIVEKAVNMAALMKVPVIGLIENYSWFSCPDCKKKLYPFGEGRVDEAAAAKGLKVLAKLPIDPNYAALCDRGLVELFEGDWLEGAADAVEAFKKA